MHYSTKGVADLKATIKLDHTVYCTVKVYLSD